MVKLLFTLCLYSIREPGRSFEEDRMNAIGHGFTPTSGHASAIGAGAHMSEVIDLFRRDPQLRALAVVDGSDRPIRSEERRVGNDCVSTCISRVAPYHQKKKTI